MKFVLKIKASKARWDHGDPEVDRAVFILGVVRRAADEMLDGADCGECKDRNGRVVGEWSVDE